jgi:hypothetical protein
MTRKESGAADRGAPGNNSPSSPPLPSSPDFDRFIELARKIVAVPRAEIDDQEKRYRKDNNRRRPKTK